jgi:hypothetical protein
MRTHSVIGLFCDDIRQEKSGQDTIIGVMPDSLAIPAAPGFLPKLCLYIRFRLSAEIKPKIITITLASPDSHENYSISIEQETISKAFSESKENGHPFVGLISRTTMSPFPIEIPGRFNIIVNIDDEEDICGSLLVKVFETDD